MAYKANSTFSFGGRVYQEGQEFVESEAESTEKLLKQGFISKGSGKSREDVEQEASDEMEKLSLENRKKRDEAEQKEAERVIAVGKNSINVRTVDQTKSIKTVAGNEKVDTADVEKAAPKKSAKKAAAKK